MPRCSSLALRARSFTSSAAIDLDQKPIKAILVRLGKPRDQKLLPRKEEPPAAAQGGRRPPAPPAPTPCPAEAGGARRRSCAAPAPQKGEAGRGEEAGAEAAVRRVRQDRARRQAGELRAPRTATRDGDSAVAEGERVLRACSARRCAGTTTSPTPSPMPSASTSRPRWRWLGRAGEVLDVRGSPSQRQRPVRLRGDGRGEARPRRSLLRPSTSATRSRRTASFWSSALTMSRSTSLLRTCLGLLLVPSPRWPRRPSSRSPARTSARCRSPSPRPGAGRRRPDSAAPRVRRRLHLRPAAPPASSRCWTARASPPTRKEGITASAASTSSRWADVGAEALVKVQLALDGGALRGELRLFTVATRQGGAEARPRVPAEQPRQLAHFLADALYKHFTREPGPFLSRIAFVRKAGQARTSTSADWDGKNARRPHQGRHQPPARAGPQRRPVAFTRYRKGKPDLYVQQPGGAASAAGDQRADGHRRRVLAGRASASPTRWPRARARRSTSPTRTAANAQAAHRHALLHQLQPHLEPGRQADRLRVATGAGRRRST